MVSPCDDGFFLTFCFMEQGGLLLPCFFMGTKTAGKLFACQPFLY